MIQLKATLTILLFTLFIGMIGVTTHAQDARKRLERELQSQTALLDQYRQQAELWRAALDEHNKRIKADAEKITAFEEKGKDLNAYIETLKDRDSVCLSDADTGRLRQLWGAEPVRP